MSGAGLRDHVEPGAGEQPDQALGELDEGGDARQNGTPTSSFAFATAASSGYHFRVTIFCA